MTRCNKPDFFGNLLQLQLVDKSVPFLAVSVFLRSKMLLPEVGKTLLRIKCFELCLIYLTSDGTLHWEQDSSEQTETSPWLRPYYRPRSADIEITSYVLLTYAHRRDIQMGLPISQWLAQQRNSLGGYSSTQVGPLSFTISAGRSEASPTIRSCYANLNHYHY